MRAILLASATATSLTWQRCNNRIGRYICIFQQLRQAPRDDFYPLRQDDAILRQNPPHVIVQGNPLAHQQTTTMVQVQDGLLLGRLGLDKPHARPLDCLADGLCIITVVLVGFQVRFNENRCHPNGMPESGQLP